MTCSIASAIITDATPRAKPAKRGWRRAANERGALMAGRSWSVICWKRGMVRPEVLCCPTCGLTLEVARPARRVPALRLGRERRAARQPAGHGGARRRGADPLHPGQPLSDPAHAFL